MNAFMYVLKMTVIILLDALQLGFLLRAIFSWFDPMRESRFSGFLYVFTEPIIIPFRVLCEKKRWFENTPIDIPFMLAMLALMLVQTLLEVFF